MIYLRSQNQKRETGAAESIVDVLPEGDREKAKRFASEEEAVSIKSPTS